MKNTVLNMATINKMRQHLEDCDSNDSLVVDPKDSPALQRIIDEVKWEKAPGNTTRAYDRIHNRHNRS